MLLRRLSQAQSSRWHDIQTTGDKAMKRHARRAVLSAAAVAFSLGSAAARADINIGVTLAATGPGAALGVPAKNAVPIFPKTIGKEKVNYIVLDDQTDPSAAVRNAKKLISEHNVDAIIGSSTIPTAAAILETVTTAKVPQVAMTPSTPAMDKSPWVFPVAQPIPLMVKGVVEQMKADGVKTVAFIGFSDPLGDLLLKAFQTFAEPAGLKLVADERYGRQDISAAGQVLKAMAANPDAIFLGGSGTPGALPQTALAERGYRGKQYQNHGIVSQDYLRVGGKSVEASITPAGPVVVADQLADSNPIKPVAQKFIRNYDALNGKGTANSYAAYAYDAALLVAAAAETALGQAKPGTPAFREALRQALESGKEVVGTHAVYKMTPSNHNGTDDRARVMVRAKNGEWELVK